LFFSENESSEAEKLFKYKKVPKTNEVKKELFETQVEKTRLIEEKKVVVQEASKANEGNFIHISEPINGAKSKTFGPINLFVQERMRLSEIAFKKSLERRYAYLKGKDLANIKLWDVYHPVFMWDYFPPVYNCPWDLDRVGIIGDGGKYICGLEMIYKHLNPCVVYSFGVNTDSSFEHEIHERTTCEIFAFDFSVNRIAQQSLNDKRVHFTKIGLSGSPSFNMKTLKKLMKERGHDFIDLLKVDIERSEFDTFTGILRDFNGELPFAQLSIELHANHEFIKFPELLKWFESLEQAGLRPIMNEINLNPLLEGAKEAWAIEYTFINVKAHHPLINNKDL
jgi:hypothetical protein